ncbi:MAG: hypothetical protein FJ128_13935 [Deltaproteobacteria bacterium]|nr:hypothetical protein [Deltaproteobacteria bacterium]MBM4286326.1 hypothetical protein [Deltaproteobacteria bacterium]
MGTSSARRAPAGARWRQAKRAATRYLTEETAGAAGAQEVAARYVAALEGTGAEGESGFLAFFRQTRKTAQDLGDFWRRVMDQGLAAALTARGLGGLAGADPKELALALAAAVCGPAESLEASADRTALAGMLPTALSALEQASGVDDAPAPAPPALPDPARLVRGFLVQALWQRLVLDLGETLEAAAGSPERYRQGLSGLRAALEAAAGPLPEPPGTWSGWEGWRWVTANLGALRQALAQPRESGGG